MIPVSVNVDRYARGVGGAAACEINEIPARCRSTEEFASAGWYDRHPLNRALARRKAGSEPVGMNISGPFIARPVATTLLTIGIALAGIFAFFKLPVAPLPQVDFPTISVQAILPGASPETVASSVAAPLERHLGQIADVTEMTSISSVESVRIVVQFGLDRDINGAARDVQAAINAARADLPTSLRSNPTYRNVNPADAPILILALTSQDAHPWAALRRRRQRAVADGCRRSKASVRFTSAARLAAGGARRAEPDRAVQVRHRAGGCPGRAGVGQRQRPKGCIDATALHYQLYTNDQATQAADYQPLVVAYRNRARRATVRRGGRAGFGRERAQRSAWRNGKPAVLVIFRQPGANIIDTVDGVKAAMPHLLAAMPNDIDLLITNDRTVTIRASCTTTEITLLIAVGLVTWVVFLFLRSARATLIPAVAVPVSIVGTFGIMYLLGYSLDILSLMALTVATGFVVDDAIVVLENISRHLEAGMPRCRRRLLGASEVGFTVLP